MIVASTLRLVPAVLLAGVAWSTAAYGQSGSLFNGGALQGANGRRTSSAGTMVPNGSQGQGQGAPGGSAQAFGAGAQAASSLAAQGAMSNTGALNGMLSNMGGGQGQQGQRRNSFVGRDDNAGRFVGSATAQGGQAGQFNQRNQNQRRNRNNANRNQQNQNFMNQGGNFSGGLSQERVIRPQLKVAFTSRPIVASRVTNTLGARFEKLAPRTGLAGVSVAADGEAVVLSGQVATEEARKLAAMLASLEPGVREVRNELTVAPPVPAE